MPQLRRCAAHGRLEMLKTTGRVQLYDRLSQRTAGGRRKQTGSQLYRDPKLAAVTSKMVSARMAVPICVLVRDCLGNCGGLTVWHHSGPRDGILMKGNAKCPRNRAEGGLWKHRVRCFAKRPPHGGQSHTTGPVAAYVHRI